MILFNTTINVEPSVEDEWLNWAKSSLIPKIEDTGCFKSVEVYFLMNEIPDAPGNTYTLQCYCEKRSSLTEYQNSYAQDHLNEMHGTFPNKVVAFQTYLQRM